MGDRREVNVDAEAREYLERNLSGFKKEIFDRLDQFETHMEKLSNARMEPIERDLERIRKDLNDNIYTRLNEAENQIGKLEHRVDANEKALESHVDDSKDSSKFRVETALTILGVAVALAIAIFF